MIKIRDFAFDKLNKKELNDWNKILDESSDFTIFQTPEWIEVLLKWTKSQGRLMLAYKDAEPVGAYFYFVKKGKLVFKKSSTGVFESPYGGPIKIAGEDSSIVSGLLKHKLKERFISKITIIAPPFTTIEPFEQKGFQIVKKQTMVLDLKATEEDLFASMHQMKRRNIKKALKNNIKIVHENHTQLEQFHHMLSDTYSRLGLSPPIAVDFYKEIFANLESQQRIILSMAYLEKKAIAASIFLICKNSIIFWQGASYKEFMKYGANDLLHWDIIKYAKSKKYSYYNLLHFHNDKGEELESLKRFKEGFGARSESYHLMYKNSNLKLI